MKKKMAGVLVLVASTGVSGCAGAENATEQDLERLGEVVDEVVQDTGRHPMSGGEFPDGTEIDLGAHEPLFYNDNNDKIWGLLYCASDTDWALISRGSEGDVHALNAGEFQELSGDDNTTAPAWCGMVIDEPASTMLSLINYGENQTDIEDTDAAVLNHENFVESN
ncbi:hypothetical protein ACHABX_06480 [Nesterenkonia halotolerans]|uniref:hypothetical protein n=1 Tax=Nesterenkonia halotolerans TaxID=225325 RepID=UPI003EE7F829